MRKPFVFWIVGILFLLCPSGIFSKESPKVFNLSLKNEFYKNSGRIVSFQIKLEGAGVHAIPKIPENWNYEVNCEDSDAIIVKGGIVHGSSALAIDYFKEFLIIDSFYANNNKALKISMKMWMVDNNEKETTVKFTRNDFILKKVELP